MLNFFSSLTLLFGGRHLRSAVLLVTAVSLLVSLALYVIKSLVLLVWFIVRALWRILADPRSIAT